MLAMLNSANHCKCSQSCTAAWLLLRPLKVELVIVMIIWPFVLNTLYFWVADRLIKALLASYVPWQAGEDSVAVQELSTTVLGCGI